MRKSLAVFAAFLLSVAALPSAAQADAAHRAAIQRYLEASRTVAFLLHFGMPIEIRTAAVERWGFDHMTLGVDEILAMEAKVDGAEFERRVADIHVRYISAADADETARSYGTPPIRRYLAAAMGAGGFLPSTDPLLRDGVPPKQKADEEAMAAFVRTPTGQRLKAVEGPITAEIFALQREFADRAVERYAAERGIVKRPPAR